ncbi:MAG TPA: glycosyltransferase, partial [Thermoproteales archaeon]|nr:glycosyltransferase [Thermoproteales archaeon]
GGYVDYDFIDGKPLAKPQKHPRSFWEKVVPLDEFKIRLRGEDVIVKPWEYKVGTARAIFFEAVCPMWARNLTERIYIEQDEEEKFLKYVLLAKASAYFIEKVIGIKEIDYVDLQEAYTALLPLILPLDRKYRLVIHTPGPWGHPTFPREYIEREFGWSLTTPYVVLTEIGLTLVRKAFVVSRKQLDVIGQTFPHYVNKITCVTNGVDVVRWMDPELRKMFEKGVLDDKSFVERHKTLKRRLLRYIRTVKDLDVDENIFVVVWARRLVRYKRPEFIIKIIEEKDVEALYILAGKAHPKDREGLDYMVKFKQLSDNFKNVVYLPRYDVQVAKIILQGSDLLTFTPFSGWEACGTSYMKAGLNGVPTLSSRDGGILEVVKDGFNGWLFGKDIREFINIYTDPRVNQINSEEYREFREKLVKISEMYYDSYEHYVEVSLNAIKTFYEYYDISRALREYYDKP